jgi:hypothetical protein
MASLPQSHPPWRFPRTYLTESTPTVLRFPNGQRIGAKLQVVSLSGGLLSIPEPVIQGSQVTLMFLTGSGSVLGAAEMLNPVTDCLQPFRFISLAADDQRRLGALIGESVSKDQNDSAWIEKLRSAREQEVKRKPWRLKVAGAVGLFMIGLATTAYLLHTGLLK